MATEALEVRIESEDFPCDELRIHALRGREAISELFWFELELANLGAEPLSLDAVAGAEATLVFERAGHEVRRVHGMIAEVEDRLDADTEHRTYLARLVPRAFRLTLVESQGISIDKTVPEIIKEKLELVGLGADTELRLEGDYPVREFVVQYKETDLAFISRLAEHLGVSFFFDHSSGKDKLVFTDHMSGFRSAPDDESYAFRTRGQKREVFELSVRRRLIPSVYVVQDYNYRTPNLDLTSNYEMRDGYGGGVIEYGAHVKTPGEALAIARIRGEERQSAKTIYSGRSDFVAFSGGMRARIDGHPILHDVELLLTEVEHRMTQVLVANATAPQEAYSNTFRAASMLATYRPRRATPRPRIDGVITAIVDPGPTGGVKTPQIDEQGRYTVRFLFDASAGGERRALSRPLRMAQPHGGPNFGMHFPLLPGVEVLVAFVDGDPDRPIIVGAVPNPATPSPVDARSPTTNRIKTASGILVEFHDGK